MSTLIERMVDFTYGLRLSDVPPGQVAAAVQILADSLACGVAAGGDPVARELAERARRHSAAGVATLLVGGGRADLRLATLANTSAVRLLDANDIYIPPPGAEGAHFSDAIAAVLAAAEVAGRSGEEALAMVIAVYELQALLCYVPFRANGWHPATLLGWAVPAPVARLLGLNRERAATAVAMSGITGQARPSWLAPNRPVTSMKTLGPGLCAERAVECVELARLDVSAPGEALERLLRSLGREPESLPVGRLGREWCLRRQLLKRHPAQYLTQAVAQNVVDLFRQGARAEDTEEIVVRGHAGVVGGIQGSAHAFTPGSREDADHSTPFVAAMALLRGRLVPADYDGAPWGAPEVRALMRRVRLVEDPEWERRRAAESAVGCRVEIRSRDGSVRAAELLQPRGHPDNPLSDADLGAKMEELLAERLGPGAGPRLLQACQGLAASPTVAPLLAAIAPR